MLFFAILTERLHYYSCCHYNTYIQITNRQQCHTLPVFLSKGSYLWRPRYILLFSNQTLSRGLVPAAGYLMKQGLGVCSPWKILNFQNLWNTILGIVAEHCTTMEAPNKVIFLVGPSFKHYIFSCPTPPPFKPYLVGMPSPPKSHQAPLPYKNEQSLTNAFTSNFRFANLFCN